MCLKFSHHTVLDSTLPSQNAFTPSIKNATQIVPLGPRRCPPPGLTQGTGTSVEQIEGERKERVRVSENKYGRPYCDPWTGSCGFTVI